MDNAPPLLLIVEDDLSTRYILTRILGQSGWTVRAVPTLAEGLALLDTKPDCVVVDLQLSDGLGEAVVRRIREQGLVSRVVVCTAVRDAGRLEGLSELRPDAVIHKPIEMSELLQACSA
jgi:DNA-binding response OmpR family regulator